MPLINGVCIPPICMRRTFLGAGCALMMTRSVNGVAGPAVNVGGQFPQMLRNGVNALAAMKDLKCDGCFCHTVARFNPPVRVAIPPYLVEQNTQTLANGTVIVFRYEIVGGVYLLNSLGLCLPPGAKVKVGNQWVPIEQLHPEGVEWSSQKKSGGKSGKKKPAGKAPPKKRRR